MRHIVWLAGCLLVLSCTVNNDNLNADAGSGGSGGCPGRCVGTGGSDRRPAGRSALAARRPPADGSAPGAHPPRAAKSAPAGRLAPADRPPRAVSRERVAAPPAEPGAAAAAAVHRRRCKSCDGLETDYDNALTAAKRCTLGATNQCQQLVNSSLSCAGCKQYVNDTTTLSVIQTEWDNQNCSSAPHVCPEIACVVPTTSVCTSSPTSGGPGGGADSTGTCSTGSLTPAN